MQATSDSSDSLVITANSLLCQVGAGYGPADFVLGRIANVQLASPLGLVGNRQWRIAGYFQDDFKLTSRLTLNLGMRYEYDQPWYEQNDKTANVLPNGTVEYAGHIPAGAAPGSIVCPTRACYNANYNQIMPRVGFAYQATDKFVIRGGYGATSFFEGFSFNQRLTSSPPFSLAINSNANTPSGTSGRHAVLSRTMPLASRSALTIRCIQSGRRIRNLPTSISSR